MARKEYNDRWFAPLVNPGFTLAEYEASREKVTNKNCLDCKTDITFSLFDTCHDCYCESFRKGN